MSLVGKLWIGCKQATYLHEKKKEGVATFSERVALHVHLAYCRFCRLFFKQIEELEKFTAQSLSARSSRLKLTGPKKAELQRVLEQNR